MLNKLTYFLRFQFKTTGKAINHKDFRKIRKNNPNLYEYMYDGLTSGYCYFINFEILKTLKKGKIILLAAKAIRPTPHYVAHMIFEKNGFVYDTGTNRQYSKKIFTTQLQTKEWQHLTYNDIKDCDYGQFLIKYGKNFAEWCRQNNCHCALDK